MTISVFLPAGKQITFVAGDYQFGNYWLQNEIYVEIDAGDTLTIGPFVEDRNYLINNLTYTISNPDLATQDELDNQAITPEAAIDDVDDSAELLAIPNTIATVNSILAALRATGIILESE